MLENFSVYSTANDGHKPTSFVEYDLDFRAVISDLHLQLRKGRMRAFTKSVFGPVRCLQRENVTLSPRLRTPNGLTGHSLLHYAGKVDVVCEHRAVVDTAVHAISTSPTYSLKRGTRLLHIEDVNSFE